MDGAVHHRGHALGHLLHGVEDAQVVRDRIEATGVDDPRAGGHGRVVVLEVHPVHELGLTGQVNVVGPGLGAGGHQRLAVVEVRADRGDDDACRLRHVRQRSRVVGVRDDDPGRRDVGHLGGQSCDDRVQLGPVPARDRPGTTLGHVPQQVLGHQSPGEPGRTVEDDVERPVGLVGRGDGLAVGIAHPTVLPHPWRSTTARRHRNRCDRGSRSMTWQRRTGPPVNTVADPRTAGPPVLARGAAAGSALRRPASPPPHINALPMKLSFAPSRSGGT